MVKTERYIKVHGFVKNDFDGRKIGDNNVEKKKK